MRNRNLSEQELAAYEKCMFEYDGADKIVSFQEQYERISKQSASVFQINSGFETLDRFIEGFEAGELILVSGTPKSGKSLLLQTLTNNFLNQNWRTCWFSYELTPRQFYARFPEDIPHGYTPDEMKGNDMDWLEDKLMEAKLKFDVKIYMIDHLHFLFDMSRSRSPSLDIGSVLRRLKSMAIKSNVIIFLIAHTGKMRMDNTKGELYGSDIRDSSFCLQEPDTILMIWRVDDDADNGIIDEAKLKVVASRRTGVRSKTISLMKHNGWLREFVKKKDDGF